MSVKEDNVSLLKRVREMCLTGQVASAELELHSVYRQAGCTASIKVVLGALLARRGEYVEAGAILRGVKPEAAGRCDPQKVKLAISILISLGELDEAERLGRAYHKAFGHEATRWLREMSTPGAGRLRWSTGGSIDELARGLANEPKAIASLVFAQRHRRDLRTVRLLRQAIRRIVPLFENDARQMTMICRAMAELSLLEGDHAQARRWAHRGLEEDPYCATLALLINRLRDRGDTALPAVSVLTCVAKHHPSYPDVQAALIRRESEEGKSESALARLNAWLEREPYSPHALELRQELAA
jgi:hypothetical protein